MEEAAPYTTGQLTAIGDEIARIVQMSSRLFVRRMAREVSDFAGLCAIVCPKGAQMDVQRAHE